MEKLYTDLPEYISSVYMNMLIDKINDIDKDVEVGWMSYGGNFWAGQTFIDYLNNSENKINGNGTGIIASMGATIIPFFNHFKVANQADLMIHSVGGNDKNVDVSNNFLYEAFKKKVDEVKFKEVTGHELKTVLTAKGNERFEVWFTGKDAAYFGLADESYDLLEKNNSISEIKKNDLGYKIPESIIEKYNPKTKVKTNHNINITNTNMDIKDISVDQLKKENRAVYDAIFGAGKTNEQKRISTAAKYASHNPEKFNEIVKSGEEITLEQVAELTAEKNNLKKVDDLERGSTDDFTPAKTTKNKAESEKENALDEVRDILDISKFKE